MTVFSTGRSAEDLTPKEVRVLDFIVGFHDQHGRFPSLRQIRVEFAYHSLAAADRQVPELKEKDWLAVRRERSLTRIESALRLSWPIGRRAAW